MPKKGGREGSAAAQHNDRLRGLCNSPSRFATGHAQRFGVRYSHLHHRERLVPLVDHGLVQGHEGAARIVGAIARSGSGVWRECLWVPAAVCGVRGDCRPCRGLVTGGTLATLHGATGHHVPRHLPDCPLILCECCYGGGGVLPHTKVEHTRKGSKVAQAHDATIKAGRKRYQQQQEEAVAKAARANTASRVSRKHERLGVRTERAVKSLYGVEVVPCSGLFVRARIYSQV
eukprot:COSAG02_NODE_66_length_42609_cov_95.996848_5_plen_231_part_00